MSPMVPEPARRLAAELELRFARDAQLTTQLGDVRQQRLQRFNDPLWTDMDPDGIATIHGEHPAAVQIAVAHNRSEILDAPNPLLEAQDAHWPIQHAVIDRQSTAARRRQLAGAGWSENDARGASVRELTCAEGLGGSGS